MKHLKKEKKSLNTGRKNITQTNDYQSGSSNIYNNKKGKRK